MRLLIASSVLALAVAAPSIGAAQELKFSAGASLVSKVVMDGVAQTTGAGFQPWVEAEYGGFYGGLWASNLSRSISGGPKVEVDIYVGYRGEYNGLSYDIGYARYTYHSTKAASNGEYYLALGTDVNDRLSLGGKVLYDGQAKATKAIATIGYALDEKISLEANFGKINKGGRKFWSVGGAYAINDSFGVGLAWHDSSVDKGNAVLSLDYSFSFR